MQACKRAPSTVLMSVAGDPAKRHRTLCKACSVVAHADEGSVAGYRRATSHMAHTRRVAACRKLLHAQTGKRSALEALGFRFPESGRSKR